MKTSHEQLLEHKLSRRASQTVTVAYNSARALSEAMYMLTRDLALLPESEHEAIKRAQGAAYEALLSLSSIVVDTGNTESTHVETRPA